MRRSRGVGTGVGWAVVACFCLPLMGWAAPTDDLRDTTDRVIKILADPVLKPAEQTKERRAQSRSVVERRFNFEEMARRSLATHWADRTAVEQKDLVRFFKRGGQWEVYDVIIDGVSLINEYRIQFNKVIRTKSSESLVGAMKAKRGSLGLDARQVSPR